MGNTRFQAFFLALTAVGLALIAPALFSVPDAHAFNAARAKSFTFPVGTTAEQVRSDPDVPEFFTEVRCWNNSATPLYFGSSDQIVYPICTDTAVCPEAALTVPVKDLWVKSSSGTLNPICISVK